MKNNIYVIKDLKVGFRQPMFLANDEVAKRMLHITLKQDKTCELAQAPADFELWRIGSYDSDTGVVEGGLEFISTIAELLPKDGE